jgi:sigma-B regulation protein RsbU (phosphoserine phosphatase)
LIHQVLSGTAERDLEIGRQIQASFLPEELPQLEGWQIASHFQAAREVAGDFYDAFKMAGGKRTALVVGDVSDKGVGAALFMALFRSLIRAFAEQHASLGWMDILESEAAGAQNSTSVGRRRDLLSPGATALKKAVDLTNDYIAINHFKANMFATLFFGVLDPATGTLVYINGGHEPPLLIGPQGIRSRLNPTGPAVGLLPGLVFNIEQVDIQPGDLLLVYTDGVTDALSPAGEAFGLDRLADLVQEPFTTAGGLLERIHVELSLHSDGIEQFDDITLLAVQWLTMS